MADDDTVVVKKKAVPRMGAEPVVLGKKWAGEKFSTVVSVEELAETHKLQAFYDTENAVPIEAWFIARGHRDHTMQASMRAYTKIRKATHEAFDDIFDKF